MKPKPKKTYKPKSVLLLEARLNDSTNWQNMVKNVCPRCEMEFSQSNEHYIINGNYCPKCVMKINAIKIPKTSKDISLKELINQ